MLRRSIGSALAALPMLAASLSAQAADMPLKSPPPAAPMFSWTGFYIGAHVGSGWGTREFDYNDLTAAAPFL
jgi:outer membrane immunogenic protein